MKLGKSQREKDGKKVVSVAVIRDGKILFGLRGDSGKWNLPGGHMEPGESPRAAAERELREETGLTGSRWEELGWCDVREGLRVYSFRCEAEGEPDAGKDPDEEMVAFAWAPIKNPPKKIMGNLHNAKDVTLQFLDMQDRVLDLIWDEDGPSLREIAALHKASLDEILAKTKARMAYMKELDQKPQPRHFPRRGGGHVVVSPDASKPGRWRATTLDEGGTPLGHVEAENHYEALKSAHHAGAVIEPPTPVQKYEQDLSVWLAKATQPEHFKFIAKAVSPEGRRFVDHAGQLHAHPAAINHEVEHYRNEVLQSPQPFEPKKGKEGITRKVIYATQHRPQGDLFAPTPHGLTAKFMVKPYHEGLVKRIQKWQKYPIQGWAEMTNQALYHAGGIGHLHQKVHVSEHDMGRGFEKEPALVVHMEPGLHQVFHANLNNSGGVPALPPGSWHVSGRPTIDVKDNVLHDVRKIALMDFLSNNMDRHGGNLLLSQDGSRVMAIDHSRSFQYFNTHQYKWDGRKVLKGIRNLEDKFHPYIAESTSAIHKVDPYLRGMYSEDMRRLENYAPAFEWWGSVSDKVKAAFEDQLSHIKDEKTRAHVRRNFHERAHWLDQRARDGLENYGTDWHRDTVPQYHDDQRTDEEIEDERVKKLQAEYEAEQKKVG